MTAEKTVRRGIKWPVCTLLILIALGALGWWGYSSFQAERMGNPGGAQIASGQSAPAPASGRGAYRGGLPFYFLVAFAGVMAAILGTILYLWWSLKDWEGGKKYGEEEPAQEEQESPVSRTSTPD